MWSGLLCSHVLIPLCVSASSDEDDNDDNDDNDDDDDDDDDGDDDDDDDDDGVLLFESFCDFICYSFPCDYGSD
jgi:hypothetical protein